MEMEEFIFGDNLREIIVRFFCRCFCYTERSVPWSSM